MNTQVGIKNFRIFGSEGATVGFKPITILTGCNSSGKSSIVKSLFILKEFVRKASEDLIRTGKYKPSQYNIDFTLPELKLKSFSSAVNLMGKDKPIVISYTAKSLFFDYKVELSFRPKESDVFDSAWLSSMSIYSPEGSEILFAENHEDALSIKRLNFLNPNFNTEFIYAAFAANYLCCISKEEECTSYEGEIEDFINYEKWETLRKSLLDYLENSININNIIDKKIVLDLVKKFKSLNFEEEYPSLYGEENWYLKGLAKLFEYDLLFYFPVFDKLNKVSKQDVRKVLTEAHIDSKFSVRHPLADWASKIADDFERSNFDNFIDYFKDMENAKLSDVLQSQSSIFWRYYKSDFFDGLKVCADIGYNPDSINLFPEAEEKPVNFGILYYFLSCWQLSENMGDISEIIHVNPYYDTLDSSHLLYNAMLDYLKMFLKNVLYPNFVSRLEYVGNFQSNVKRLFSFDDKSNNLSNTIRDYLELKRNLESMYGELIISNDKINNKYTPGAFMNKWVKKLGIGYKIIIKEVEDGLGANVLIQKKVIKKDKENNIEKKSRVAMPLADEGYGITQVITFLLHIENEILRNYLKDDSITMQNNYAEACIDGTPVSRNRSKASLAIEEPEVSLHPSLQSHLTDIFYDAYNSYGVEFIIETHSEYLIRRTQAIVANMTSENEYINRPFAVYYVDKGGQTYELKYLESGRFENNFGPGFFDEASRSSIQILQREKRMKK